MAAVSFDTLKLARKLRDTAEMTQAQAEGVADALAEAMSGAELATKSDLVAVETALKRDISDVKNELKSDIRELELKMDALSERTDARFEMVLERIDRRAAESDARLQALKTAQFRWLFTGVCSIIVTIIGTAVAVIRYLPEFLHH